MEQGRGRRPVFAMDEEREVAKIKVIGLGGGGSNAVNRMMAATIHRRRVHRRQHRSPGAPLLARLP